MGGSPPPEIESKKEVPRPGLLDIVRIDGEWAQVILDGDVVKFLKTGKDIYIDWDKLQLTRRFDLPIFALQEVFGLALSPDEEGRVWWGSEQETTPRLRGLVHVFGEYESVEKDNSK